MRLGTMKNKKKFFHRHVLCSVCQCVDGMVVVFVVFSFQVVDFYKSMRRLVLTFDCVCAKMGLAYLLNGRVVEMPYLCNSVNSTVKSSFRLLVWVSFD